eukprot:Plantae.Rhodophyta-Rhodochaete_pulchella.ctg6745.p3 GENE.Plantae.Rhodophyta-Rhodochaete_pulchella.ctg6745~~Plantae.Rhodophyta-Rhodochaete_pulchella.ctg6745.p3  ORF type:complete len:115 (+),score=11.16 Plantae.Rhodophyta-Rhodochaete_pulchella.ctg6745:253-597(+)
MRESGEDNVLKVGWGIGAMSGGSRPPEICERVKPEAVSEKEVPDLWIAQVGELSDPSGVIANLLVDMRSHMDQVAYRGTQDRNARASHRHEHREAAKRVHPGPGDQERTHKGTE